MLVAVVSFVAISLPLLLDILLCCVTLGGLFLANGCKRYSAASSEFAWLKTEATETAESVSRAARFHGVEPPVSGDS